VKIMRVFLTGINGYLGGVLAEHFSHVSEIESITGIDVVPPKKPLPEKARFVQMDVRSQEVSTAMAGHDMVVHTAFVVLWPAKMSVAERDDINLNGTRNMTRAAVANRVKRLSYRGFIGATKQAHRSRSVACPQLLKAQNESEDRRRKRIEFLIADRGHSLGGPVV